MMQRHVLMSARCVLACSGRATTEKRGGKQSQRGAEPVGATSAGECWRVPCRGEQVPVERGRNREDREGETEAEGRVKTGEGR